MAALDPKSPAVETGAAGTRSRPAIRSAVGAAMAIRLAILVVGALAAWTIGYDPLPTEQAAWRVSPNVLANLPARWDAYWYLDVAAHGYSWVETTPLQQNPVFFPVYPLLIRMVGASTGWPLAWAGVAISLAAFAAAARTMYRVASIELGEAAARRAVLLMTAYPFAIYYGAVYTESVFVFLLLSAWLAHRERRLLAAAAWGVLLGATRPNGFIVCAAFAWLALEQSTGLPRAARLRALVAAATPLVGLLAFSVYLAWAVGAPMAWFTGQFAWGSLSSGMATAFDPRWGPALPFRPSDAMVHAANVAAVLFAIGAVLPILRRFGTAHALLVGLSVLPPLAAHGILSMGRFTSVLFPLFLLLASRISQARERRWLVGLLCAQVVVACLFYTWRIMV